MKYSRHLPNLALITRFRPYLALRTGMPQEPLLPNSLADFPGFSISWEIAVRGRLQLFPAAWNPCCLRRIPAHPKISPPQESRAPLRTNAWNYLKNASRNSGASPFLSFFLSALFLPGCP